MLSRNYSIISILALSLLIFVSSGNASVAEIQGSMLVPIEWQAIRLQESIERKISKSLNPIIKETEYVIEVKISTDLDRAEDPSSKKITKTQQKKKIRFSSLEAPKEGDDFVVFNKLGLEAPVVGEDGVETETSEVELAQKAIIEMNDRYNLFNFMNGIEIKLTFDKQLSAKTKESIQKVVQGLSFNTKDVVPQVNIQYLDLKEARVKTIEEMKALAAGGGNSTGNGKLELPKNNKTSWDERFKNLDIMIGIITAAFLLGVVALIIAKKGSKHEGIQQTQNENSVSGETTASSKQEDGQDGHENDSAQLDGDDMTIDLTKNDLQTQKIVQGLERFRKMMSMHYSDTILLVKGWIKVGKGPEAEALKGLVATLEDNELAELFKSLTIDERGVWKMCLDSEMKKEDLAKSFAFISNRIIESMMVPSLIDDYEICDLLLALSAEDAARFCTDHRELGAIFANVLSAKTIGEMFAMMPINVTTDIIERSSMFRKEEVVSMIPLLKEKLIEIKHKRERPPFLARIFEILPNAKIEIEKKLYATLIKHCSWEDVRDAALNTLPGDLISNLPESIYKEVVGQMALESQVQYFAVQDEDDRESKLSLFAPKGAKNREMIEVELSALVNNEIALKRLQTEKRESIEHNFLSLARVYVSTNPEAKSEIKSEVESWLRQIKSEENEGERRAV